MNEPRLLSYLRTFGGHRKYCRALGLSELEPKQCDCGWREVEEDLRLAASRASSPGVEAVVACDVCGDKHEDGMEAVGRTCFDISCRGRYAVQRPAAATAEPPTEHDLHLLELTNVNLEAVKVRLEKNLADALARVEELEQMKRVSPELMRESLGAQRPAAATAPDTTTFAPWAEGENVACPRCTASVFLMRDGSYRDRKAPAEAGGLHVCAAATAEPPTSLSAEAKLRAQQTATDQQEPARAADVIRSGAPRPLTVPSTAGHEDRQAGFPGGSGSNTGPRPADSSPSVPGDGFDVLRGLIRDAELADGEPEELTQGGVPFLREHRYALDALLREHGAFRRQCEFLAAQFVDQGALLLAAESDVYSLRIALDGYENFTWPNGETEDAAIAAIRLRTALEAAEAAEADTRQRIGLFENHNKTLRAEIGNLHQRLIDEQHLRQLSANDTQNDTPYLNAFLKRYNDAFHGAEVLTRATIATWPEFIAMGQSKARATDAIDDEKPRYAGGNDRDAASQGASGPEERNNA